LALKPLGRFSLLCPQNRQLRFGDLGIKITATISWFGHQNHRDIFLVWASKPSELQFIGCATKPTEGGRRGTCVKI
jgi:hypothetical protein